MKEVIHLADTRGTASFGWLQSRHSFSFGHYFNPNRIQFGALRVLNDDVVAGGGGFPTHPHDNMEIISIPLSGALAHKDSTGTEQVIHTGEVQIMSAGTGLTHSEYNYSKEKEVNFLQIWILPKEKNIAPRYDQRVFDPSKRVNKLQPVVSPNSKDSLWINQDAWLFLSDLDNNKSLDYQLQDERNGVYILVLDGVVEIGENTLQKRDAIGITETSHVDIRSSKDSKLLIIEVPMN